MKLEIIGDSGMNPGTHTIKVVKMIPESKSDESFLEELYINRLADFKVVDEYRNIQSIRVQVLKVD